MRGPSQGRLPDLRRVHLGHAPPTQTKILTPERLEVQAAPNTKKLSPRFARWRADMTGLIREQGEAMADFASPGGDSGVK